MKIHTHARKSVLPLLPALFLAVQIHAAVFEGRIHASLTRGGETEPWLYTSGTNSLRVEITGGARPNAVNILDRTSGELTLLFPHNRSFVKLKPAAENAAARPPGFPAMPVPANIGPTNLPGLPAPSAMPQMPAMPAAGGMMPSIPAMPMMPMPGENLELKATGENTNLLGYACEKFEIKGRGEVMEIWATAALPPFQNYLRNQRPRFGPRMIEEQWGDLLAAKKLFPLRAVLKFENGGAERLRFEVKAIVPGKIEDRAGALFQPPSDYQEIQPLPF